MNLPSPPVAPALGTDDPHPREARSFPRLTPQMAARIAAYRVKEPVLKRAQLFECGQRSGHAVHGHANPGLS